MDNAAAPYRLIITAACTLVVGWGLGYIMGGPSPDLNHVASANASSAADGTVSGDSRRTIGQAYSDSGDQRSAFGADTPVGSIANASAQFETLVRGALR